MHYINSIGIVKEFVRICLFFIFIIVSISCNQQSNQYQSKVLNEARYWKAKIESDFVEAIKEVRLVASSLQEMKINGAANREAANAQLVRLLENKKKFLAVWTCWEPNAFDGEDSKFRNAFGYDETGHYNLYWTRLNGKIETVAFNDQSLKDHKSTYQKIIRSGKEFASNPIDHQSHDKKILKVLFAVPITYEGKQIGVVGVDLSLLDFFYPIVRQVRVLDIAYGFLVANNGVLTAHPTKWMNVGRTLEQFSFQPEIIQAVHDGKEASQFKTSLTTGQKAFYQFVPIQLGNSEKQWSLAINLFPDELDGSVERYW